MSPRTKEQFEEMREKSRTKILNTALELFATHSYRGTTIDQIAKKSGVSKGLIYNYFSSKEELLQEVIDYGLQIFEEFMVVFEEDSPEKIMRGLIEFSFAPELMNNDFYMLYFSLLLQPLIFEKYTGVLKPLWLELITRLESLLRQMGFDDPENEARLLGAIIDGIQFHYLLIGGEYPLEEIKQFLIERYCHPKK